MRKKLLNLFLGLSAGFSLYAQPYVYNFQGDFTGTGPTLTSVLQTNGVCGFVPVTAGSFNPNTITTTFCAGTPTHTAYDFAQGEGLAFDNSGGLITGDFTIHVLFRFDAYPVNTYQRLIDVEGSTNDVGLYVYQSSLLLGPNGTPVFTGGFTVGTYYLVTLVRTGTLVELYADGALVDSYDESTGPSTWYVPSAANPITFFRDDNGGCEDGSGSVRYISVSPTASTAPQVALATANICASVLPLSLIDFSAQKQNSAVQLKWITESEVNTSHFDVERSSDGKNFTKLISVQAVNGTARNNYSFIDRQPLSGTGFYRLKMLDIDGHFKYSGVLKINFSSALKFEVFPNPARESVTVSGILGDKTVKLMSLEGKTLIQKTSTGQSMTLDISKYPSGVYIVVYSDGETTQRQKVVKN